MAEAPKAPKPAPYADKCLQNFAAVAQQLGISNFVVVIEDPQTKVVRVAQAKGSESLRGVIADRLGLDDGADTGWS